MLRTTKTGRIQPTQPRLLWRSRQGFTLIELLVVIAIIAILAAILFPVFARARAKAQQATCLSNVKQITLGCIMYASDWHDYLPMCRNSDPSNPVDLDDPATYKNYAWGQQIYPYVKNLDIFLCPNDPNASNAMTDRSGGCEDYGPWLNEDLVCFFWWGRGQNISYGYNNVGLGWRPHASPPDPFRVKQAQVWYPSETLMIADQAYGQGIEEEEGTGFPKLSQHNGTCWASRITSIHNRGANLGFADGHAKWLAYPLNRTSVYWYSNSATRGYPDMNCEW